MPGHMDVKRDAVSLDSLLDKVRRGEEVELADDGRVFARLVPVEARTSEQEQAERERLAALRRSAIGMYANEIRISDDAFAPDQDLIEAFYADNLFPEPSNRGPAGR